jgi:hypothetical protein
MTWKWDREHFVILGAFTVGATISGVPIVAALMAGRQVDPITVGVGVTTLLLAAVRAFFKHPPQNPAEAFVEGEDAVKPLNPPEPPLQ